MIRFFLIISLLAGIFCGCHSINSTDLADQISEFGLDSRPDNSTCIAPPLPPYTYTLTFQKIFENLTLNLPVKMIQAPGDNLQWYLLEQEGQIFRIPNISETNEKVLFLDLSDRVVGPSIDNNWEFGLLGFAFHPEFSSNGMVFSYYTSEPAIFTCPDGYNICTHTSLSKFLYNNSQTNIDPTTEQILLTSSNPSKFHHGGDLAFDKNDYLLIAWGEKGIRKNSQDLSNLEGSLLRIDINMDPYSIPVTNPFFGTEYSEEIFAYGFRNPWRISVDDLTGDIWLADVGEGQWEEINKIEPGNNYGWPVFEGYDCFQEPCELIDSTPPYYAYSHDNGCAVIGGYVYRGNLIPSLNGTYIFGDFCSGNIWGLPPNSTDAKLLAKTDFQISSFAQDNQNEIYVLDRNGGFYKIAGLNQTSNPDFPRKLSETGCFLPSNPQMASPGLIQYDVRVPLWSDGLDKARWLAIPNESKISVQSNGKWKFPSGTILIKSFYKNNQPIETRLLMQHSPDSWSGYSYEWDNEINDAFLVEESGKSADIGGQIWAFPSRSDCLRCHTEVSGRVLGLESLNLNRSILYNSTGVESNQIRTLHHIGLLDGFDIDSYDFNEAFPNPDTPADFAKAYLHVNCAMCHQPGGPGVGGTDFRYQTPLFNMGVCKVRPLVSDLGLTDPWIVDPGNAENSIIWRRMIDEGEHRMPPLATHLVDSVGSEAIKEWIESLVDCVNNL